MLGRRAELDGTNIPTCSYNVLYRENDPRFADPRHAAAHGRRRARSGRSKEIHVKLPDLDHAVHPYARCRLARGVPLVLEGDVPAPAASWSTACGSSATARSTCASSARAHGASEALISGDADWFLRSLTYIKEGSVPLKHSTQGRGRLSQGLRPVPRSRAAQLPADHRDHQSLQPRVPDLHRAEPQQLQHDGGGVHRHRSTG